MPIKLPLSLFIQNTPRVGNVSLPETATLLVIMRAVPLGGGFHKGLYHIQPALHSNNPGTQELMVMKHGEHLIVATHPEEGIVAFVREDYMWVHESHRGQGLGPEIAAQLIIELGCKNWDETQWSDWLNTPRFTVAGHKNRYKVYDVLVRRGIVEPPDNT